MGLQSTSINENLPMKQMTENHLLQCELPSRKRKVALEKVTLP